MKKYIGAFLTILMLASLLAGCAPASPKMDGSTAADPAAADADASADPWDYSKANIDWRQYTGAKIRVMMATHYFTDGLQPKIPEFKELTGIDLQFEAYPEQEFWNKLLIEFNGGASAPDVFMVNYNNIAQYHSGGWVEPLDPYINNPKLTDPAWYDQKDVFAKGVDFGTYENNYYGVPVTGEWEILFYRKDLYEQNGLKVPETFDELYENCKVLHNGEVAGMANRCARASAIWWPWSGFVRTYGGYWVQDRECKLDEQAAIDATEMYVKLLKEFGPKGIANYTYIEALTDFQQGRSAHFIDSSGFMAQMEDKEKSVVAGNVGYAMLPVPKTGDSPVPNVNHWMLGMGKQSQNKDAAYLFLQWATSKKISKAIGIASGTSARTSVWEDAEYKSKYPQEWIDVSLKSAAVADKLCIPNIKEAPQIGEIIEIAITDLMSGSKDAAAVLKDADEKCQKILG